MWYDSIEYSIIIDKSKQLVWLTRIECMKTESFISVFSSYSTITWFYQKQMRWDDIWTN